MKREEWHQNDDNWAEVEIYRLAHGHLPDDKPNTPRWNRNVDTADALEKLADQIMSEEPPNRLNAAEVCLYSSKVMRYLIDRTFEIDELASRRRG